MRNFSEMIVEERSNFDSVSLLQADITSYINKVNKQLPSNIKELIQLTSKFNLTSKVQLEEIRNASKSQYNSLAEKYGMNSNQIDMMHDMLKKAGRNIRLLPQYQSAVERAEIEAGKLAMSDLTIDLSTSTGRNAVAKMYVPMVMKIVNQYVGKSKLDKPSLIGAGMEGLAMAINEWKPEGTTDGKRVSFKTYAGYRIQQSILNEINKNGHDLSGGNSYNTELYGAAAFDAISLDSFGRNDDGETELDHLAALGEKPDVEKMSRNEQEAWNDVFAILDKQFSKRDMDIFYRYFGIGPYYGKKEKSKDIAKSYGMSEGNIKNTIINKILKFLQSNAKAKNLMNDLRDIYTESLVRECINLNKNEIRDILYYDDTYVLLENINMWDSKEVFNQVLERALYKMTGVSRGIICNYFESDSNIEDVIESNRNIIDKFLMEMYPSDNIMIKSDHDIMDIMKDLKESIENYKIELK